MATRKKTVRKSTAARGRSRTSRPAKKAPARRAAPPKGLRLGTVSPSFTVNDLAKSLAFYRDVLGFTVTDRWERDGQLLGVELAAGAASFMIGQDDWKKGRDRQKGVGFRIYCTTTQDVDALAALVRERGATLEQEPTTEKWGRFFAFADPDGFKVTVVNEKTRR